MRLIWFWRYKYFGVCETRIDSRQAFIDEMKELGNDLDSNSRVFPSLVDPELQAFLHSECESYIQALKQ